MRRAPVEGRVRLTVRWPEAPAIQQPFQCGERLRAVVRLLPPEVYHDPGVWSREDFLVEQGITSTATVSIDRLERFSNPARIGPSPGLFLACRVSGLQRASSARLLALPAAMRRLPAPLRLSEDDAIMLAAMVTGDRTFLTHSLRVGFERTGSFHMLVISGFHLAIVAGCLFWVARRLRLPRVPATFATILASFAYAIFTGFATPVARSLWMVTLYLLGRLLYRERNALNTIGFAALCLLAYSPRSLFDASFQMTLLAVVAIGGVAAPLLLATVHPYLTATRDLRQIAMDAKLAPRLAQFRVTLRMMAAALQGAVRGRADGRIAWRFFPSTVRILIRCFELMVVSCVVELAMALPMAVYFHRITVFALPVNVFILPLLLILMPAALITLLVALVLACRRRRAGHVRGFLSSHWHRSGALLRLDYSRRLPHSRAAALAVAHFLRAACGGYRAGPHCRFVWSPLATPLSPGPRCCWPLSLPSCLAPSITPATPCSSRPSTWARAIPCC